MASSIFRTESLPIDRNDSRLLFWVFVSVFSSAWVLMKEPFEFYSAYLVFLPLLPIFISKYSIPATFYLVALFFLVTGVLNIFLDNDTTLQFFKIYIGLMLSYLFYYYILQRFEFNSKLVFDYYLKAAFVVTIIGAVQFISYIIRFKPGYDYRWLPIFNKWAVIEGGNFGLRINAIFGEPSTYAAVMAPAMFVALYNIVMFKNYVYTRIQSILVLGVYLFTFSSLGYMGIFIAVILLLINYGVLRYLLLFIPILIGAFFYLYNTVPDFQYRWDSTIRLFQTGEIDIREEHGSSIVFYNNYHVAMQNFQKNYLFGTGLGSHPVAFEKYSLTKDIAVYGFANNSSDANSMMLRIISEIGFIGIAAVFIFIGRGFVKRDRMDPDLDRWIISSATLCVILLYLLRQGHYFLNGFPLFVWLYWYNKKNYDQIRFEQQNQLDEEGDQEDEEDEEMPVAG